ncbi:MAG TPA: phosphoglucomutase/phosphomannomutase family protein [Thermoanaerobaculia bacterium]|nr:phosphoglucomutase/phosphomannomutase family protein [Thermoanaerobaculia bacterium]
MGNAHEHDDIIFGTDGWRAVIADGFTFANVRRVAEAIGVAAQTMFAPPEIDRERLVVGYDRRFLSPDFAQEVALVLSRAGFHVHLSDHPTPSQTISFAAAGRKILGGVVITASHNPASYNGIKFKGWYGGSALPGMYAAIAENLGKRFERGGGSIVETDLLAEYVEALRARVDVEMLRSAKLRILHDPIHGVAAGIPSRVLGLDEVESRLRSAGSSGMTHVTTIRGESNPSFGGVNPEPIPENLAASREAMRRGEFDLAICNDGDADRLGILDERGEFVSPHKILALLALYLVRDRGESGEIVKTFSTGRLIERVASRLGVTCHETPVGFKHVADLMLSRPILIGGEESGGIGFGTFIPERDGILSGLLVAEFVARSGRPLSKLVAEMERELGSSAYDRRDLYRSRQACERLVERARAGELDSAFGLRLDQREDTDGVKLNFDDGSWILFRISGTEPLIRIYCESASEARVESILETAVLELDRVAS